MLEHFKGEEVFVKKVIDYQDQAINKQRIILTNFLDPRYQEIVKSVIGKNKELQVLTYGGYDGCEFARIIIAPSFYQLDESDFRISKLKIKYASNFTKLTHREVLGALMHLGIKREVFGDIIFNENPYIICDQKIVGFLQDNLNQISKAKVKLVESDDLLKNKQDLVTKTFIVSSLRLDKIISSLFKISRNEAVKFIGAGHVKVNHKLIEQTSYLCNNNDTISFLRHGRVNLIITNRKTKSDNFVVEGHFFK